jgi:hypothetical protein
MFEILLFTVVAIALYLLSDWILKQIETYKGRQLENRTLLFFVILMTLALSTFTLIRNFAGG